MAHPQIKLSTQEEIDALDWIRDHFGASNDAENYRQALRVLTALLRLRKTDRAELVLTTEDGDEPHEALPVPRPGATKVSSPRRWTVALYDRDLAMESAVQAWAETDSTRATRAAVVIAMGDLIADMSDGWVLWAKTKDEQYRLVVA